MKFQKPYTLSEIADFLDAGFEGDPGFPIEGINEIHNVQKGDLTFVDHPKYYKKALSSAASTVIINEKVQRPEGKALIFSRDPFAAYMKLVKKFRPFIPAKELVASNASVGEGTVIQPGVFIGNNVKIGKNCIIHANVTIYDHTVIGDNVIIHSGTVIGADAFYFQKRKDKTLKFESCGRVIIKDNVEIGALCTVDKGVSGDTVIDEYTKLDNHIQIGHDTYIGKRCLLATAVIIAGVSHIGNDVILWGQVAVNKEVTIGDGAVVLAVSAVDKDLEGGITYFGAPAVPAGQKWREMALIRKLPEIYKKLF